MNRKIPAIEAIPNAYPGRDYEITIEALEFTSRCPRTGHPDFGTITIDYVPGKKILELKALKIYLQGFRERGVFYETLVNDILDVLVANCRPRAMTVTGRFTGRGGLKSTVVASTRQRRRR